MNSPPVTIGLLDFGFRQGRRNPVEVIQDTIDRCILADHLGLSRFWLGEHHNLESTWGNPEALIPILACRTSRIRIGSGGILLGVRNPIEVSCNFSLFEHIFPGRIDLGLCRGRPGVNAPAFRQCNSEVGPLENYEARVGELLDFFNPYRDLSPTDARPLPYPPRKPEIWLLGSNQVSMRLAARFGLGFSFALFLQAKASLAPVIEYLNSFESPMASAPRASLAVAGVCAESGKRARQIVESHQNSFIHPTFVGTPDEFRNYCAELAEISGAPEILFLDLAPEQSDRLRSCELLAHAFQTVSV